MKVLENHLVEFHTHSIFNWPSLCFIQTPCFFSVNGNDLEILTMNVIYELEKQFDLKMHWRCYDQFFLQNDWLTKGFRPSSKLGPLSKARMLTTTIANPSMWWAGFESTQNWSSGFVKWSCAVVTNIDKK